MCEWAPGKQEVRLDLIQLDLPWVFLKGDGSVEDELL